jgi:hypothetical protein
MWADHHLASMRLGGNNAAARVRLQQLDGCCGEEPTLEFGASVTEQRGIVPVTRSCITR